MLCLRPCPALKRALGRVKHARCDSEKAFLWVPGLAPFKICCCLLRIRGSVPRVVPPLVEIDWSIVKDLVLRLSISFDVVLEGALHFIE